jgi:hypothetical protein
MVALDTASPDERRRGPLPPTHLLWSYLRRSAHYVAGRAALLSTVQDVCRSSPYLNRQRLCTLLLASSSPGRTR